MKREYPVVLKNLLIHLLLVPFYLFAQKEIWRIPNEKLDTLVLFVGLIVIAPITANFIYTYRGVREKHARLLGHTTTFYFSK